MRYVCLLALFTLIKLSEADVCDYSNTTETPSPPPNLAPIFSARIEWKRPNTNTTTIVREVHNSITQVDSQEIIMEGQTYKAIVDYQESQYITYSQQSGCSVVGYGNLVFFQDKMWLSPLNMIHGVILNAIPIYKGPAVIRSTQANWYQSCLFFYEQNTTVLIDMYYSSRGWLMPDVSPDMYVPLRINMMGETTQNGTTTSFHVIGDITDYIPGPTADYDFMQLPPGVFCTNKKSRKPINLLPNQFSMIVESIDMDQHTIVYENIWFDPDSKLVRRDSKEVTGTDADTSREIFDFNLGIHYLIDPYMGKCQPVSVLSLGDKYVVSAGNQTIRMMTAFEYFHVQNAQTQYVGFRSTRGVACEVWIGQYLDQNLNYNVTVEWYFAVDGWSEAIGGIVQPSPLVRMDIWVGGSTKPIIKNILQLDIEPVSRSVYDITDCYPANHRARILTHFTVANNHSLDDVSLPYLRDTIQSQLVTAALLPPLRIMQGSVLVSGRDVFFDGVLLDNAPAKNPNIVPAPPEQYALVAVLEFLNGVMQGGQPFLVDSTNNGKVALMPQGILQVDYQRDFTTTPITTTVTTTVETPPPPVKTPSTVKQLTPTEETPLLPPLTTKSTTTGPTTACVCPKTPCTTAATTTSRPCTMMSLVCSTVASNSKQSPSTCTCPAVNTTTNCPVTTPCPKPSCTPCPTPQAQCPPCRTTPCPPKVTCPTTLPCPSITSQAPCPTLGNNPNTQQQRSDTVSGGAAGGIAAAMLIMGILIGIALSHLYTRYRALYPDTKNLVGNHLDDETNY